mmetsp:Transcript_24352/g.40361  ORF Transcript_24352/g.40361 Transcript_24352/m.40361 type:complete len:116 (+) Transcript_24352:143-490(+)
MQANLEAAQAETARIAENARNVFGSRFPRPPAHPNADNRKPAPAPAPFDPVAKVGGSDDSDFENVDDINLDRTDRQVRFAQVQNPIYYDPVARRTRARSPGVGAFFVDTKKARKE